MTRSRTATRPPAQVVVRLPPVDPDGLARAAERWGRTLFDEALASVRAQANLEPQRPARRAK